MDLPKSPVAITVLVLDPDLADVITAVSTVYDRMENPWEVNVAVTEEGLMDDDLLAIPARRLPGQEQQQRMAVVKYGRGELRRVHFK